MSLSYSPTWSGGLVSRLHLAASQNAGTARVWVVAPVLACLLGSLAPRQVLAQNITLLPVITTVAGTGTAGYTGDGGPAIKAELDTPGALLDQWGNLYISNGPDNVIREVDSSGNITTIVGGGTGCGNGNAIGDGCPATSAILNSPHGLAFDGAGDIYISDGGNNRIRVVNRQSVSITVLGVPIAAGTIATIVGTGAACSVSPCGDGGSALTAQLNSPYSLAFDGNFLYIADTFNHRIRIVNMTTLPGIVVGMTVQPGNIATLAGDGTAAYSGDGGSPLSAELNTPYAIFLSSSNGAYYNLYIADTNNNRIRVINMETWSTTVAGVTILGRQINTVAGTGTPGYLGDGGPATAAELDTPHGMAVDNDTNLYFADATNNVVREVNTGGTISTFAGNYALGGGYNGDGGAAVSAQLNFPVTVALDHVGNLYIGDYHNNRVRKVISGPVNFGQVTVGANSKQNAYLSVNTPLSVQGAQASGDYSVVEGSCPAAPTVISAGTVCSWEVQFTPTKPGLRWSPLVVTDGNGKKYSFGLEGSGVGSAMAITPGIITTVAGSGTAGYSGDGGSATGAQISYPQGVTMDNVGNLYISDSNSHTVRKVDTSGKISTVAGNYALGPGNTGNGGQATGAQLYTPAGLAVDSAGNLYIADATSLVIRKVDVNGIITTVAGGGTGAGSCPMATDTFGDGCPATVVNLSGPFGVALDGLGNLYFSDENLQQIRKVDINGIISLVAGDGNCSYSGDNFWAIDAEVCYPGGIAVDAMGNVYIADSSNARVRVVNTQLAPITVAGVTIWPGGINTVAGNGTPGYGGDGNQATSASAELYNPFGVTVDAAGNIYIADYSNFVLRKVDTNGIITTIVGNQNQGYNGDNGSATNAELNSPIAIATDSADNLYIADYGSSVIRKVNVGTSTLAFGSLNLGQTSSAQSVAVSDVGNANLNFTAITPGTDFEHQSVDNGCAVGTPVGIGQTCELGVAFAPLTAGNKSETIALTDDAFNSPQVVNLSGSGIATPAFSNLTPSQSVPYGTSSITLSGTISAPGPVYPPSGETVSIGIGALVQNATIGVNGSFSTVFNIFNVGPLSLTPAGYAIAYRYPGDSSFNSASDFSKSLIVTESVVYVPLTLTELGTGSGTVTDNQSSQQINCSEVNGQYVTGTTCTGTYTYGTAVTLTATVSPGTTFAGWGGACASSGTVPTCSLTATESYGLSASADFIPTPTPVLLSAFSSPGTNVSGTATYCPNGSSPCNDPNGYSLQVMIPQVTSGFPLYVTATEFQATGLCTYPPPNTSQQVQDDPDCRFASFFNYGTDPNGNTIVPLCYPYANGNCVHYDVFSGTSGNEPPTSSYSGGVFWKIGLNNSSFLPASYWLNSLPRILDDPDADEFTPPGVLPYGTNCNDAMVVGPLPGQPYSSTIYCQFVADITLFYNPSSGLDKTVGGKTQQANDVVVAFLPTSAPVPPPPTTAPAITGVCVNGCSVSGTTLTFSEGTGGTFQVSVTAGYPSPTLTEVGTLPAGLAFNTATGLISGTPADGTYGNYLISFTAANGVLPNATLSYTLAVNPAGTLTITASSPSMIYGGTVPTITPSYTGFVNGDTAASLTTQPKCSTTATSSSPVIGSPYYPSTCSGAADPNYSMITNVPGTVTVNPAPLSITASNGTMTYGEAPPTITPIFAGLVNNDNATTLGVTCTPGATSTSAPGSYLSSCTASKGGNYAITPASGTVTVSAAPVVVTAGSATMTYGGPVPNITPSYAYPVGTVSSHAPTTPPMCSTTATVTSLPGTYPSTCVNAADPDYTFTYVPGTVTVVGLEVSPLSVNFGTLYLNGVGAQLITLTNKGTTPITISSVKIAGGTAPGDYGDLTFCPPMILSLPARLPAGKSCPIGVGIAATAKVFSTTASTATLTITDSAASQTVLLTAQVINPQASFSSTYLSSGKLTFQTTTVGKSNPQTVTVTNPGNTPLTLGNPAISIRSSSGDFALTSTTCNGATVYTAAEGGTTSCVISLTFTPKMTGTFTGTLTIKDNAQNSPQTITLSGTT
ncbi:hypothetical protein SBA1_1610006 [Candidatus Sulfotelmatobacter kueseliae]|uniref:NHL repeat containing protein n=1 Tax=Candidatus Sulfotelmatobacter kueseliae TaxID=2042962 RepID=A0A2U3KAT2_9BACT|nr:hypothetical protein SBA1_1610006 [Candidatus Sulfotelmatobacter kueseliae]